MTPRLDSSLTPARIAPAFGVVPRLLSEVRASSGAGALAILALPVSSSGSSDLQGLLLPPRR